MIEREQAKDKDKIDFEERWQVIHYIRSLQAKEAKMEYSPMVNTLNAAFGTPGAKFKSMAAGHDADDEHHMDAGGHDGDHGAEQEGHDGDTDHGDDHSKK